MPTTEPGIGQPVDRIKASPVWWYNTSMIRPKMSFNLNGLIGFSYRVIISQVNTLAQ
jgi:hypothetical protein